MQESLTRNPGFLKTLISEVSLSAWLQVDHHNSINTYQPALQDPSVHLILPPAGLVTPEVTPELPRALLQETNNQKA
jgi:hypothetical protein